MSDDRLVVVRTGFTDMSWYRQGKWSTPEQPLVLNNQTVRNLVLQGVPVIVLFVGLQDVPLFIVRVREIRGRDVELDAAFPYANAYGPFLTFMTFDTHPSFVITPQLNMMFSPIVDFIRYIPGQEVSVTNNLAQAPIRYYNSLASIINRTPIPLNTTYILPN